MTPGALLFELHGAGVDAGTDFNDGLDGWFGWRVEGDVLSISFQGYERADSTHQWRLVSLQEEE